MSKYLEVPLGELLTEQKVRVKSFDADGLPLLGVSNIEGLHRSSKGRIGDMSRYLRVEHHWFAYNPMRINVGSIGWAESGEQTGVISPDYVVFSCTHRVEPKLVYLFLRSVPGLRAINLQTAGSVRERLYFDALARIRFPLPPLAEQRRVLARIEELASQIHEARTLRQQGQTEIANMLSAAFHRIADGAPRMRVAEVAPIVRRPVEVDALREYPELGIRSFGRGTFHKPALTGLEVASKRIYRIEPGDLLFSNVFAWEGAIAVAKSEDAGRFGSHRYITCVPHSGIATYRFLCFYFLTREGLARIGEASPGGAGRNRTLGLSALSEIDVPVPTFSKQQWFDTLQAEVDALKRLQAETAAELDALLPAVLDRAFRGEL
jgi:type I restriction enzyme S subunit